MSNTLKILFIQASALCDNRHGERLETRTREKDFKIQPHFIQTHDKTVNEVTEHALEGEYDAIVVDADGHTFSNRDEAYTQLGLTQKKEEWKDLDPRYELSPVALVQHIKSSFEEAGKSVPKFGYIELGTQNAFAHNFRLLNIETNANFHLSTGYESSTQHVCNIYGAFGIK